jgi:predicted negative regulator of RcsB-dependent stress response
VSSEKLTRKEIRSPDAFQRVSTEYWNKVVKHRKAVLIGVGAFFGIFLLIAVVSHMSARNSAEAGAALSRALEVARRGVEGTLDPSADPDAPKFATFREKNEELARQLEEVLSQFPGTDAAVTAGVWLADAQFHLGKLDEAAAGYEEYLKASPKGTPLRTLALESLGYVYEAKKDFDKALDAFDRMSKEAAGEPNKARAELHRGRVLELQGKKQEAAAAFRKVKDTWKEAPASREASERLGMLAAQGVVAPAADDEGAQGSEAVEAKAGEQK